MELSRDHQAPVSREREPTSTACPSPTTLTSSLAPRTKAYDELLRLQHDRKRKRTRREEVGDLYGKTKSPIGSPWPARVSPAFKSLFQQHHLGVEYALSAHSSLLEGLLLQRFRGGTLFHKDLFGKGWSSTTTLLSPSRLLGFDVRSFH